jgi:hypothetical protein
MAKSAGFGDAGSIAIDESETALSPLVKVITCE